MSLSISPSFFFAVANCFVFFVRTFGRPQLRGVLAHFDLPHICMDAHPFPIGNTSSFMLDFPDSYFSLPEGKNSDRN